MMKRMSIVFTLVSVALAFAYSRTSQAGMPQTGGVKKAQVTAQTIASQPAGKPYVLDFTRAGTVYEIASGLDYSRVRVRTATGEQSLSELARKFRASGKFLLGSAKDLSAIDFGFPNESVFDPPGVVAEAKCEGALCTCTGKKDCKDMAKANWCKEGSTACGKGYGASSAKWGCICAKEF
jgi:hypothetical protein